MDVNEEIDRPILEILTEFEKFIELRASSCITDYLEHGEPQLAIDTLISVLCDTEIRLPKEQFDGLYELAFSWEIGDEYLNAFQELNNSDIWLKKRLKEMVNYVNISNVDRKVLKEKLAEGDLRSAYILLIENVAKFNAVIQINDYKDLVRIGLIIHDRDPSLCLKINRLVPGHIENDSVYYKKILDVIQMLDEFISEDNRLRILEYLKYSELWLAMDDICLHVGKKDKISPQAFDLLSDIAKKFHFERTLNSITGAISEEQKKFIQIMERESRKKETKVLGDIHAPIPEIFEKFKKILGLRFVFNTTELIKVGEPQLAVETLIPGMDMNNIYITPQIFQSFMDNWKLKGYYLDAVYRLNTKDEHVLNGLNKFVIRLPIPEVAKSLIVDKINEGDLSSVYNSIIESIIQHETALISDDYSDLVRLGLIIEGVDPSLCLKINHLVASHIENDAVYYKKIIQVIKNLGEYISEDYQLQLLEYLKYNELEELVDSICFIIEKDSCCITQKTFDLLSEIARKFNCEDHAVPLIIRVNSHKLYGQNYWGRIKNYWKSLEGR